MRVCAITCFLIAAFTTFTAFKIILRSDHPEDPSDFVGYLVGTFLIPFFLTIVGLVLWNKSVRKGE